MRRYRRNRGSFLDTKSPELFRVCETSASPNLWGTGHSRLPNVTFKAMTLVSCDIQRKCISSFENLQLIHVLRQKRDYSVDTYLQKLTLTPRLLDTMTQQRY